MRLIRVLTLINSFSDCISTIEGLYLAIVHKLLQINSLQTKKRQFYITNKNIFFSQHAKFSPHRGFLKK